MNKSLCRLCLKYPIGPASHFISKLVFRAIKAGSKTGRLRNPNNPNLPRQDGDKGEMLCEACEGLFNKRETEFANKVFLPFCENDRDEFEYGPWLHYFMTSQAWRTLILDLPGLAADEANPRFVIQRLGEAAETMRLYLLGADKLGQRINNHAVLLTRGDSVSQQLAGFNPNAIIRGGAWGYTLLDRERGYSAVLHNLAGFACFLVVKGNPQDRWNSTKISATKGKIKQPQRVSSWFVCHLLESVVRAAQGLDTISDAQRQKVLASVKNPTATSGRFQEWDRQLVVKD